MGMGPVSKLNGEWNHFKFFPSNPTSDGILPRTVSIGKSTEYDNTTVVQKVSAKNLSKKSKHE